MIVIHCARIERAGGIETAIQNLVTALLADRKVMVLYEYAHEVQIKELEKRGALCVKNSGQTVYTHVLLRMNHWSRPRNVISKATYDVIHANFSEIIGYQPLNYLAPDGYVAVSERAKQSFLECNAPESEKKKEITVIENLLDENLYSNIRKKHHKKLSLLSVTRLTAEKGGDRIIKLANMLDSAGIEFEWNIYSPTDHKYRHDSVNFHEATRMKQDLLDNCDYLVQLSDTESFCYTIREAIQSRTPVIVTNWNGVRAVVDDGSNGHILPMDMDFDVSKLLKVPKITSKHTQKLEDGNQKAIKKWNSLLDRSNDTTPVAATQRFFDIRSQIHRNEDDMFFCSSNRADELINKGFARRVVEWVVLL